MRRIDWDAPLSEEDLAWLAQAGIPGTAERIERNQRQFEVEEDEIDDDEDDEVIDEDADTDESEDDAEPVTEDGTNEEDDYETWTRADLITEASTRTPAVDVKPNAKKMDVVRSLRTWDAAHPSA